MRRAKFWEDYKEYLLVMIIIAVLMSVATALNITHILHESIGHGIACQQWGGTFTIRQMDNGYKTDCIVPESLASDQDEYNFLMAGIFAELVLSFIFLIIPITSPLGGWYLVNISWGLIRGGYNYDLTHASQLFPGSVATLLLNPTFQIVLLVLSGLVFALSIFYLWIAIRKWVDIPGI